MLFPWQAPSTHVTLGLPESKALLRKCILAYLRVGCHCGMKEMLAFHWFHKGEQETIRIPCSSPPRFMRRQGFAWRTIENVRDSNDFQGFCSRIRWRPKSATSFPHRLLCSKSLFSQGFSTVSGKPSESLFWQAPFAQKACFIRVSARFARALFWQDSWVEH